MTTTYEICPFTTKEEKILVGNGIPFTRKGNSARFQNRKDFVRATFRLVEQFLPTEKAFVKGVL